MAVYKNLPEVKMTVHNTHEEWDGITNPVTQSPSVYKLELSEHTGSHVDALNHMNISNKGQSIDTMPLSMFYTEGICLDFSNKDLKELITVDEIQAALDTIGLEIKRGDTVLFYTDHYRRTYGGPEWPNGPGITAKVARWLGNHGISAFGVETMSPGIPGISNKEVHHICGELGFTHYENLINLHKLVGRGRFQFIGLPLKIKGGTGSPVRAIAVFNHK